MFYPPRRRMISLTLSESCLTPLAVAKLILGLVLFLNLRAFPFVWHIRVFRPPTYFWLKVYALQLRTMFSSRTSKNEIMEAFFEQKTLVGRNPLDCTTKFRSWASLDECDCNLHLSNSSYAKSLDCAIVKSVMHMFPQFVRTSGWLAIAGTHFHFIREIPILARYEVRVTIASWDQKWIFALCRFVTEGDSYGVCRPRTLVSLLERTESQNDINMKTLIETGKLGSVPIIEPDGATVHAIAISQLCFKIGRITVPPNLVFASNGFSMPPPSSSFGGYSHSNPPPHWKIANSLISRLEGGDIKNLRKLYVGGWRDIPEDERWWDQALGGDVEVQRSENMKTFSLLRKAMEDSRK